MLKEINKILQEAIENRFWGSIQVDFQEGRVTVVRKNETFKIGRENNRHDEYTKQENIKKL